MNNLKLIKCPTCSSLKDANVYIGSVTAQGDFIMRQSQFYTCIHSESFTIIHDCGFTIKIESGIIQELSPQVING